jgi:hypothetical protein
MKRYFDKTTFESHVHAHDRLLRVNDRFFTVNCLFFAGQLGSIVDRTMTIYRMNNGKLWIHAPAALNEETMKLSFFQM